MSTNTAVHVSALPATIPVLDPYCRGGILHVPVDLTFATKGRNDWVNSGGCLMRDLSVCCLHQQGRCRAGNGCRQIHCDSAWIAQARKEQANVVSCCLSCGDTGSVAAVKSSSGAFAGALRRLTPHASVNFSGPASAGMPSLKLYQLAATSGAAPLLNQAAKRGDGVAVEVPWTSVCRLHLKDSCKYGKDCKNVHVCCKLGASLLAIAASNANAVVSETVRDIASKAFATRRSSGDSSDNCGIADRVATTPVEEKPAAKTTTAQPPAPAPLRATYRLDEGSLLMKDPDLDGIVFALPTIHSATSTDSRCDLFGFSPAAADTTRCATFYAESPSYLGCSASPKCATPMQQQWRVR